MRYNQIFGEKVFFTPRILPYSVMCNGQGYPQEPCLLPSLLDKRQKPSREAKMDLWPRSCLWKLQLVPNTSVWDDKMMWLLAAAAAQCSGSDFCCSVLSLPCHGTPRLLLALQAEPLPHPDSTMTCFKWTHLKTCWNKSKTHDFC